MPTSFDRSVVERIRVMVQLGDLNASDAQEFLYWYQPLAVARCECCQREHGEEEEVADG